MLDGLSLLTFSGGTARYHLIKQASFRHDTGSGPFVLGYPARVYAMSGWPEQAIATLERLSRLPSWVSPAELRTDPIWSPLRGHPRFEKLAASEGPVS